MAKNLIEKEIDAKYSIIESISKSKKAKCGFEKLIIILFVLFILLLLLIALGIIYINLSKN